MIVDQAEEDVEMSQDPFLEAGVTKPPTMVNQENGSQNPKKQNGGNFQANLTRKNEESSCVSPISIEISDDTLPNSVAE